jgi:hypothetical protein
MLLLVGESSLVHALGAANVLFALQLPPGLAAGAAFFDRQNDHAAHPSGRVRAARTDEIVYPPAKA